MFRPDYFASDIDEREFFGDHGPARDEEKPSCEYCGEPPVAERHGEALCREHARQCEDCEHPWTVKEPQPTGDPLHLCDDCNTARAEDADEAFYADFHGGSGLFSDRERCEAAAKVKR